MFQGCQGDITASKNSIDTQSQFDAITRADALGLPTLLSKTNIQLWKKNTVVVSSLNSAFIADGNTVVIAVKAGSSGQVYSLNSGADIEDSKIVIENGFVRAIHRTDINNYSVLSAPLPGINTKFIAAVSFGIKADDITLLVNGLVQTYPIVKTGAPLDYSLQLKQVTTSPSFDTDGEVVVYVQTTSALNLNVMSRYIATTSQVANVVFDRSLMSALMPVGPGGGTGPSGSPAFIAAKGVIDSKCISCHNSSINTDFRNLTQDQFIQKNLVTPKDLGSSKIYYRLLGSLAGPGPANMPNQGSISAAEVKLIADWISGI